MGAWAGDGESFYMRSNRSGQDEMWRHALDDRPSVPITRGGARSGFESDDGQWLYYVNESKLWRVSIDGGETEWLADNVHSHKWRLAKSGAYYTPALPRPGESSSQIRYFDFDSRQSRLVLEVDGTVQYGMAVSPDERRLLFTKAEPVESDLMLIEGFE